MVFISRLRLRNFKSFKAADVQLPKTYICFAGPNGSGKSNLCDAVRFVMGETSLKSLRAKRVKDLIHADSRSAEVTITFDGENNGNDGGIGPVTSNGTDDADTPGKGQKKDRNHYEIKRAIREDGKILYRLNGERTTRSAILELLRKYNLDSSGRNTIAQGEVQRIINMQGKERRTIIDSVAGITDFEDKKKEAIGELGTVEDRIKEANLVLGERRAFLEELRIEKDVAIRYTEAKKTLTNAKGTMLRNELGKLEKELEDVEGITQKILFNKNGREQEMREVEAKIQEIDARRMETSRELQAKQKTNALIRKVEELKAACGSKTQLIDDREKTVASLAADLDAISKELTADHAKAEDVRKELDKLRADLKAAETKLAAQGGFTEDAAVAKARKALEEHENSLMQIRETLITLNSEITSATEITEAKKAEVANIKIPGMDDDPKSQKGQGTEDGETSGSGHDDVGTNREKEIERIRREVQKIAAEVDGSFSRTKEINVQMGELDKKMLELKEKASIFKVRISPHLADPALTFISEIKSKTRGVHGTVADLITFDPKYSVAVEAAAGGRLKYVVVDDVETATEVIEKLKKARSGRATFIPLDKVRAPPTAALSIGQATKPANKKAAAASILGVIEFPENIRRAAEYVFAETLLVEDVAEAKALGIGSARMVTLEGEIFERSGIISGGRSDSGILSANQLRKIENELAEVKSEKESMLHELYTIREDESKLRAEKSQLEIRIKMLEMEIRSDEEKRKGSEHLIKRKGQLKAEIDALLGTLRAKCQEKDKLTASVDAKTKETEKLRQKLADAEDAFRKQSEETSKKRADLSAEFSALKATLEGKTKELELRKKECMVKEERTKKLERDRKETLQGINEVKRQLATDRQELTRLEGEITSASKEMERLFGQMKEYEEQFAALGKALGAKRAEVERFNKDLTQATIRKTTALTRLEDIKLEFAGYQTAEIQFLDAKKEELVRLVAESERAITELGSNINMAAIEMYDRKKAEIEDVQQRIEKLDSERQAILSMIGEIEERKKEAFFETFTAVSDHFTRMFKHIQIGEGHLYLDKPATPFESGLFIKIRRNNKDYSLDALSGGEKTLVALMFIYALQFFKPAPFYILDEVDAALDKPNSRNLAELILKMAKDSQFIVVSHNDIIMSSAESVIGVAKTDGMSKLVGIKLKQVAVV